MIHNFTKTAAGKKKLASGMKGKHLCWMKIALLSARRKGKRGLQGCCQTIEADFNQINTFLLCQVCSPYPRQQQHRNTCRESLHTQATFRNGDVTCTQPLKLGFITINCWKSHPRLIVNWPLSPQLKTVCTSPPEGENPVPTPRSHLGAPNYSTKMSNTDKMTALKGFPSGIIVRKRQKGKWISFLA